jgi:ankyrin repeat protein
MIAAGTGDPRIVRMLIEHGARVDAVETRKGQNALMWAAAGSHAEAVEALVKASANPNAASKAGLTPLIFAAVQGDAINAAKSASSLLAAGADANYKVPGGMSALPIAIASRKMALANVLIAKGADVKLKDNTGTTLLHIAAQLGDVDVVKALLGKGAEVNARTNASQGSGGRNGGNRGGPAGEQTPLMLAARGNHVEVMRALIAAGADPKLKAQDGSTLLMAAAGSGHLPAVEYAYSLNPDVKAVTNTKTAVMHAAVSGTLQNSTQPEICRVVQFLADKGADLDPVDQNGRTPIMIADVIPIDTAVELLIRLIRATGAQPHVAPKQ